MDTNRYFPPHGPGRPKLAYEIVQACNRLGRLVSDYPLPFFLQCIRECDQWYKFCGSNIGLLLAAFPVN